jgi:hypothetical protein
MSLTEAQKLKAIQRFPILAQWGEEGLEELAGILAALPCAPAPALGSVVEEMCETLWNTANIYGCWSKATEENREPVRKGMTAAFQIARAYCEEEEHRLWVAITHICTLEQIDDIAEEAVLHRGKSVESAAKKVEAILNHKFTADLGYAKEVATEIVAELRLEIEHE